MKDSYWIKEIKNEIKMTTSLGTDINADIVIIGGGFVGLWTSLAIKENAPEKKVVVLEKNFCGSGASGRNGGMVMSWWPKVQTLIKICGIEEAFRIASESEKMIDEIGSFCETNQIDAEFKKSGWLWTATTNKQRRSWSGVQKLTADNGKSVFKKVSSDDLVKRTGSAIHLEGVIEESNATVQPAKLAQGIKKVALSKGVEIYENTNVDEIIKGNPAIVKTSHGSVTATKVVIANNAWAPTFEKELSNSILVVTSTVLATKELNKKLVNIGWVGGEGITDSQLMVGYYRTTQSSRIIYGKGTGGLSYGNTISNNFGENQTLVEDTLADLFRTYPMISRQEIDCDWTGPIDRTYDSFPLFGHLPSHKNIIYGVGWSGNGVGPSRLGGKILSSLALELDNEWTRSKIINRKVKKFPIEPIRYLGGNLVRNAVRRNEKAALNDNQGTFIDTQLAKLAPSGLEDKN